VIVLDLLYGVYLYTVSQKTGLFFIEHNFGKCCPILIILSLLQTEINCNQAYPKIYNHAPNLLVHYVVKLTRMYRSMLPA